MARSLSSPLPRPRGGHRVVFVIGNTFTTGTVLIDDGGGKLKA
ncbi:hypothetical protein ACNF49_32105 [Actinomadura sp. ATCC 39365]